MKQKQKKYKELMKQKVGSLNAHMNKGNKKKKWKKE
jgi:uncharacterized protein YukJ